MCVNGKEYQDYLNQKNKEKEMVEKGEEEGLTCSSSSPPPHQNKEKEDKKMMSEKEAEQYLKGIDEAITKEKDIERMFWCPRCEDPFTKKHSCFKQDKKELEGEKE